MSSHSSNQPYSPSAPPLPDPVEPPVAHPYYARPNNLLYAPVTQPHLQSTTTSTLGSVPTHLPPHGYEYNPYQQHSNYSRFPPGTHPDVIRSFQMVDRNQNGFIEGKELQEALAWNYQRFSLRTLRLLIFLFRSPNDSSFRIGPKEFAEIWSCLGHWRAVFERFDRDRSGKIDTMELKDALYSLGYALPPSVLQVLISKYNNGNAQRVELSFDTFVECGMIVKGLTEKFKEKDPRYTVGFPFTTLQCPRMSFVKELRHFKLLLEAQYMNVARWHYSLVEKCEEEGMPGKVVPHKERMLLEGLFYHCSKKLD